MASIWRMIAWRLWCANASRTEMEKRNKIIYWIATVWLCLGMTSTGIVQIIRLPEEVALYKELGYPLYFMSIVGIWKLLGVIAVLVPNFKLLKEWAYAGFFFVSSGAAFSHIAMGHPFTKSLPLLLLLTLTVVSWYFRPANRKVATSNA